MRSGQFGECRVELRSFRGGAGQRDPEEMVADVAIEPKGRQTKGGMARALVGAGLLVAGLISQMIINQWF